MKTKTLSVLAAFIAAFTLLLSPATTMAQIESYTGILKGGTTGQTPVTFEDCDSAQITLALPDTAACRVKLRAQSCVDGNCVTLAAIGDTINVKNTYLANGGIAVVRGASNLRISFMEIKAAAVQWHVMPANFIIEVIFNSDSTYGTYADQATKYYTLSVRKFRHTFASVSSLETSLHVLKRSTTIARVVEVGDIDSMEVLVNWPDSAQGRIRAQTVNSIGGVQTAVTGDTALLKLIDGKNIGGGQTRICWAQLKALSSTAGVMPRYVEIDAILDATVTASGGARPVKLVQIDVRKFKHR